MSRKVFSLLLSTLTFHNKISHLKSNRWNVVAVPTEGKAKGSKTILTFDLRLKHTNGAGMVRAVKRALDSLLIFHQFESEKKKRSKPMKFILRIISLSVHHSSSILQFASFLSFSANLKM